MWHFLKYVLELLHEALFEALDGGFKKVFRNLHVEPFVGIVKY